MKNKKKKKLTLLLSFAGIVLLLAVSNFIYFYDPFNWRVQKKDLLLSYEIKGIFATRDYSPLPENFNLSKYTEEIVFIENNIVNVTILLDLYLYSESFRYTVENRVQSINITYFDQQELIMFHSVLGQESGFYSWVDVLEHSFTYLKIVILLEFQLGKKTVGEIY